MRRIAALHGHIIEAAFPTTSPVGLTRNYLQSIAPSNHAAKTPSRCFSNIRPQIPVASAKGIRPLWASQSSPNLSPWKPAFAHLRTFSNARPLAEPQEKTKQESVKEEKDEEEDVEVPGFGRTEKASRAAQVNLSARLAKGGGKTSSKPSVSEIWRLIKIARPESKWLGVAFICLLVSSAITMSIPFSIGKIIDLATKDPSEGATLFGLTMPQFYVALGSLLVVGAISNYGRIILLRVVGERIVSRLRSSLYRRTYTQDAEFFDANRVGDLISRLSSDTVVVGKSITQNLSDGLRALVSGGAGFAAMAWVSLKLTSLLCLMLPPVAIGAWFYGIFMRNISRRIQRNLGSLTKVAEERLGNVKTSQAFCGEIQEVHRYNHQIKKIFSLGVKESLVSAVFYSASGFAGNITILALLYFGGSMVKAGMLSIGDLSTFLLYTVYAGSSLFGVTTFYSELMKGVGAASRLFELQDRKPSIPATVGSRVKSAQGPITFSNVSFAYPTRPAVEIFQGLEFEIPSGQNVAVVGPSGGGKSTIGSLLLRFYTPTKGAIKINGVDIASMNGKSLRRRIGLVGQEPVLFSGSIAENIAYGKPNASKAEIVAAARKANCEFIADFPDGLETSVGARGAQLSGGQKQRIAIARALLKNPDILILDEATSALDAESETLVNSALTTLLQGHMTTISIAHRLSTIKRSDQIIVLGNDGKVAEIGSYEQLSADSGSAFSKLMEWQMTGGPEPQPVKRASPTEREEIEDDIERLDEEEQDDEDTKKTKKDAVYDNASEKD